MEALLLLGGNVGDVAATFTRAEARLAAAGVAVMARSRDHVTEPWGFADERWFLNRALLVRTEREPAELLDACLAVERTLGRTRVPEARYTARTIDIDILFIGDRVIHTPGLRVPHPRVAERAFALAPAADLVPDLHHPELDRTVLDLLNDVRQRA